MESVRDKPTDVTPKKLRRTEILQESPSYLRVHERTRVPKELTSKGSTDFTLMESLPTEVLQKILSCLPVDDRIRVERVCKRWKNVSTERVWRDIQVLCIIRLKTMDECHIHQDYLNSLAFDNPATMKDNKLYLHDDRLEIIQSVLSRAGRHIRELFVDSNIRDQSTLSKIAEYCHNIESIQVDHVGWTNVDEFLRLLEVNKQLHSIKFCDANNSVDRLPLRDWKSLFLGGIDCNPGNAMEKKLVALIENSPSLESFRTFDWSQTILTALLKCKKLKNLSLPDWSLIAEYEGIMETSLLNRLTHLYIGFSRAGKDQITNLLHHCINLESLGLSYDTGNLPFEIEQAVLALPKLESLELNAISVNDEILSRLLKFKNLTIMASCSIGSISIRSSGHGAIITTVRNPNIDNGIFEMIKNSEYLKQLNIPKNNVSMESFKKLPQIAEKRRKILKIGVSPEIYKEALKICEGSKIHVIEKFNDFVNDIENRR